MRDAFRRWGYEADVYAFDMDDDLEGDGRYYRDWKPGGARDVVLFHYALPSAMTHDLREHRGRRVVIHHNVTPPEFFQGYDPEMVRICRIGREELALLKDVDLGLGDSEYNARRAQCEEAVRILKEVFPTITALRDVAVADFNRYARLLLPVTQKRARHVVEAPFPELYGCVDETAGPGACEGPRAGTWTIYVTWDTTGDAGDSVEPPLGAVAAWRGWGGENLLASYERERLPIALRNTAAARQLTANIGDTDVDPAIEQDSPAGEAARRDAAAALSNNPALPLSDRPRSAAPHMAKRIWHVHPPAPAALEYPRRRSVSGPALPQGSAARNPLQGWVGSWRLPRGRVPSSSHRPAAHQVSLSRIARDR